MWCNYASGFLQIINQYQSWDRMVNRDDQSIASFDIKFDYVILAYLFKLSQSK